MSDFMNPDEQVNVNGNGGDEDMENMVLDLGGVDENRPAFEAMPVGTYDAIVENVEFKKSQSSGNPMLSWTFKVTDPEYANRLLFYHTVLSTDAGKSALKRTLMRVCPGFDMGTFRPQSFCDEGHALGMPCRVKVNIRPYQGERRNNVQDVLAPAAGAGAFMPE